VSEGTSPVCLLVLLLLQKSKTKTTFIISNLAEKLLD
jgi:hypothetical protein